MVRGALRAHRTAEPGRGRRDCARCGAATTDPWPSPAELERAYAHYRPEAGRFSRLGDAVLRRTRARLAGRIDRVAPPGPGAGRGRRRRHAARRASRARGREALGLERDSRREDVREADVTEVEGRLVGDRLLALARAPARPRAAAIDHAARRLRARGRAVRGRAEHAPASRRACSATAGSTSTFPATWSTCSTRGADRRGCERSGWTVTRVSHWRGGQALFGWLHGLVGTLPGRARPLRRDPAARGAQPRRCSRRRRALALAAAVVLFPSRPRLPRVEVAVRRGGTVYVEARRG